MNTSRDNQIVSVPTQKRIRRFSSYLFALMVIIFISVPIYAMVIIALQPPATTFSGGRVHLDPSLVSLQNIRNLIDSTQTVQYFINSFIITAGTVILATLIGSTSGYVFTRFKFRGRTRFAKLVLFAYMFSPIVLGIPLYLIFRNLGMLNSHLSVILGLTAIATPFSIWLMWKYFQTIPISFEERSWIQGAGRWKTLWNVVIPIARPGMVSTAIFSFAVGWNSYTMPRILLSDTSVYPITVGSSLFLQRAEIGWSETMAMALLISIPPFLVALLLQEHLLQGFNVSGL